MKQTYLQFRASGMNAAQAYRAAKIKTQFDELEAQDLVRMRAEPEEDNYFDVYGVPDTNKEREEIESVLERDGCWVTISEYRDDSGEWQIADSCGMHTGYRNVLSPFENWYVVDEMSAAIDALEANCVVI